MLLNEIINVCIYIWFNDITKRCYSYFLDNGDQRSALCRLGEEYARLCLSEYRRSLSVLGSNMVEFFSNLDGFHDHILKSSKFNAQRPPSFRCESSPNMVTLHIYTERSGMLDYYAGIVRYVSNSMFNLNVQVSVHPNETNTSLHHIIKVETSVKTCNKKCACCSICSHQSTYSDDPEDLRIGFDTFCETFPFHLIMNRNLEIGQLGSALMKIVRSEEDSKELVFSKYFNVIRPEIKQVTFSALLSRVNFAFLLQTKVCSNDIHSVHEVLHMKWLHSLLSHPWPDSVDCNLRSDFIFLAGYHVKGPADIPPGVRLPNVLRIPQYRKIRRTHLQRPVYIRCADPWRHAGRHSCGRADKSPGTCWL